MIIDKLNAILNSTEQSSIRYEIAINIKDHMNNMASLSIGELADICHVSKSMISKFSKELGYDSYIDLKDDCQVYQNYSETAPLLAYHSSFKENCYSYIEEVHDVMTQLIKNLNLNTFHQLINDMDKADCLYLYGNEKDNLICQKFQKDLDPFKKLTVILDYDLPIHYPIKDNSLFIIFYTCDDRYLNSQIIKRIINYHQPVWLITTKDIQIPDLSVLKLPKSQIAIDNNLLYMFTDMIISTYYSTKVRVHKL